MAWHTEARLGSDGAMLYAFDVIDVTFCDYHIYDIFHIYNF